MKEKTILHVDVNNFFASVECSTHPELKDKPVAVTGNPEKRTGIILAKNDIAKKFGVKTGEAIWEAKQKCADLVTLAPHYELYQKISAELQELYQNYTDLIEPMGLDECWLDVTASLKYLGKSGKEIADEIRQIVKEQFGFTVSVGVSFSKIFAKLGSDYKKPDATTVFSRDNLKQKAYPLPLNSIVGIGRKLTAKFEKMNINTIGDFVNLDENFVEQITNKAGHELWLKLRGEYDEKVENFYESHPPKSIGNGTTTVVDVTTREDIEKVLTFLCEKIANRMKDSNFQASTVGVTVKTADFHYYHHNKTFAAFRSNEDLYKNAINVLNTFWDFSKPVRAIRVSVSNLKSLEKTEQLSFFGQEANELTDAINEIKEKFGRDKIFIASDTTSFINRKNKDEEHPQ